jgi:hypothetical protein
MTPSEWTRFVSQCMHDAAFREDARAGRLDALRRAGFELDASDMGVLRQFNEMDSASELLRSGVARPFMWANFDGPVCEAVAVLESDLKPGKELPDVLVWSGESGLVKKIKQNSHFSGFRHEFNALAVSQCMGSTGPVSKTGHFRVATAWRVGHAGTQFRDNFDAHEPKNQPTNASAFELSDLLYADGTAIAIVPDLQIIRLEWTASLAAAKFIGEELVTLIRQFPGLAGYRGGLILRKQVPASAGIPRDFQLLAAFDPAANFDTANASVDLAIAAWQTASGTNAIAPDRRFEWLVRLNTLGASPTGPI